MPRLPAAQRAAIYLRESEETSDIEAELLELRDYAAQRGFEVVREYVYGAASNVSGPDGFRQLLSAAYRREFDVVLVWRNDRFAPSRQSLTTALETFRSLGVDFVSYQEAIDTTTPGGDVVFRVAASLARFGGPTGEQVKAGMAEAKAQGKRVSRPPISEDVQEQIKALYEQGTPINQISKRLGVAYGTAWNYVKRFQEEDPDAE